MHRPRSSDTIRRAKIADVKTSQECNIILGLTQEYRPPPEDAVRDAAVKEGSSSLQMPFSHRFVGLVVVPGKHITKIELEEYIAN